MKTVSSPALALGTRDRNETPMQEIALWRIYLLRAGYLLIAVGMGIQKVPAFLHHRPWAGETPLVTQFEKGFEVIGGSYAI